MQDWIFVNANILIYDALVNSTFHWSASTRLKEFEDEGITLCVSGQVIKEYLSGMTREMLVRKQYDPGKLSVNIQRMEQVFEILEENQQTRQNLINLLFDFPTGGKQIHDANIVATMQHYGVNKLLTNNLEDFRRFGEMIELIPLGPEVKPI